MSSDKIQWHVVTNQKYGLETGSYLICISYSTEVLEYSLATDLAPRLFL